MLKYRRSTLRSGSLLCLERNFAEGRSLDCSLLQFPSSLGVWPRTNRCWFVCFSFPMGVGGTVTGLLEWRSRTGSPFSVRIHQWIESRTVRFAVSLRKPRPRAPSGRGFVRSETIRTAWAGCRVAMRPSQGVGPKCLWENAQLKKRSLGGCARSTRSTLNSHVGLLSGLRPETPACVWNQTTGARIPQHFSTLSNKHRHWMPPGITPLYQRRRHEGKYKRLLVGPLTCIYPKCVSLKYL